MDGERETVMILDETPVPPVTLSGEVSRLCAEGDQAGALVVIARALELLQQDSHPPQEIAPRVEAVLRSWGYIPLTPDTFPA
jgi:hypothetical protein